MKSAGTKTRRARRIAVFLDRSRDLMAAAGLVHLEPDDRYHVTDGRVRLTARRLAPYDVLVIAGDALDTYSRRELAAIVEFTRRGGGLLLAGAVGVFQRFMHRPLEQMAVCAIARRFGIEYLPPDRVAGRARADSHLVKGYPPESARLRRCAATRSLRKEDVFLSQWSPVRSARRATVLLAHRITGEAAALSLRFGRGRVVAVGGTSIFRASHRLCRCMIEHLASGRRPKPPRQLPWELLPRQATRRSGNIEIRYDPLVADRVRTVLAIARKLVGRFDSMVGDGKKRTWRIELGGGCRSEPSWGQAAPLVYLGAEAPEPELAFALGAALTTVAAWRSPAVRLLSQTVLETPAGQHFGGLTAMRWAGFDDAAETLGAALARESRRRFKGLDAGRFYCHGVDAPGLWIWRELARRHGRDILERFFKAVPRKLDRSAAPEAVFTQLDLAIHFLSRVAKADLYPWFEGLGATVHPLPLHRFGGKAFKQGVRRYLSRRLRDGGAPACERADALEAMIACQQADKQRLASAVRQLGSRDAGRRLVAATRLLRAGDARGLAALAGLARARHDDALAAMAALQLVAQGQRRPAGRLAQLAAKLDHRFQLDAGYQLGRIGDARAERFSLEGIRRADGPAAARLETLYQDQVRVFPTVDGQHVANIFSLDVVGHMPHNAHFTMFYLNWVHTAAKFRRKGLSRAALKRTMADPLLRRCACAALHTGTRNVAHALYRSFGFVDAPPRERLLCQLSGGSPTPVRGIRVRPYRPGDEPAMARLCNAFAADSFAAGPARPRRLPSGATALLAYRGRKAVGYLQTECPDQESAAIREMAVDRKDKPEEIARALVGRLHRDLRKRGVKQVSTRYATAALAPLLQPLGYRSERGGGVAMIALENLPQFFREIAPLLSRRAAQTHWAGTIAVCGERHRAALKIDRGEVTALPRVPARPDIRLSGSDGTITRIVTGIETPFEAHLQLDLQAEPMLTERTQTMLEKLWPRLEVHAWLW